MAQPVNPNATTDVTLAATWTELTSRAGVSAWLVQFRTTAGKIAVGATDGGSAATNYHDVPADQLVRIDVGERLCVAGTASAVVSVTPLVQVPIR